MALTQLPRKYIFIDERGRITIPERFRKALDLPEGEKYPVWIEEYRNEQGECRCLIIRK